MTEHHQETGTRRMNEAAMRKAAWYTWTAISFVKLSRNGTADWRAPERSGAGYLLLAAAGGRGKLLADGLPYEMGPGQCHVLPAQAKLQLKLDKGALSFYCLAFEALEPVGPDKSLEPRDANRSGFPYSGSLNIPGYSSLLELLEGLYAQRLQEDELQALEGQLLFQKLMLLIVSHNRISGTELDARQAVQRTMEHARSNYHEPLTVEELAGRAGLGRWQYSKLFKQAAGELPLEYVNRIRIERAKQLLVMTDDRLLDIASHIGFNNEYYFSRRFKQTVGVSPGQYRRNHRENIRVFSPYLEDYLVALGITPVAQFYHNRWGKQEYLKLNHVPEFDVTRICLDELASYRPEFILLDDGAERWRLEQCEQLAPTVKLPYHGQNWRPMLLAVAELFGRMDAAHHVIASYESKVAAARNVLQRTAGGQTVAFLRVSAEGVILYGGAGHGYTGTVLYEDLGLKPDPLVESLTAGENRIVLTIDQLAELQADHLFITFDKLEGEGRELLTTPLWRKLPAVKGNRVYEVDFYSWLNYGVLSHKQKIDDVLRALTAASGNEEENAK
jgi:ABC-type Fe3+-hydroxamate transport system substrate-binding protein/AraC-like DNA-binding protein